MLRKITLIGISLLAATAVSAAETKKAPRDIPVPTMVESNKDMCLPAIEMVAFMDRAGALSIMKGLSLKDKGSMNIIYLAQEKNVIFIVTTPLKIENHTRVCITEVISKIQLNKPALEQTWGQILGNPA